MLEKGEEMEEEARCRLDDEMAVVLLRRRAPKCRADKGASGFERRRKE